MGHNSDSKIIARSFDAAETISSMGRFGAIAFWLAALCKFYFLSTIFDNEESLKSSLSGFVPELLTYVGFGFVILSATSWFAWSIRQKGAMLELAQAADEVSK